MEIPPFYTSKPADLPEVTRETDAEYVLRLFGMFGAALFGMVCVAAIFAAVWP